MFPLHVHVNTGIDLSRRPKERRQGRTSTSQHSTSKRSRRSHRQRIQANRTAVASRSTLGSSARWGASSAIDVSVPGKSGDDRRRCRHFRARCPGGDRNRVDGTVVAFDGSTLAFGMLFHEDVVAEVKRLQRKACANETRDDDLDESWAHGSTPGAAAHHATLHSTQYAGKCCECVKCRRLTLSS